MHVVKMLIKYVVNISNNFFTSSIFLSMLQTSGFVVVGIAFVQATFAVVAVVLFVAAVQFGSLHHS